MQHYASMTQEELIQRATLYRDTVAALAACDLYDDEAWRYKADTADAQMAQADAEEEAASRLRQLEMAVELFEPLLEFVYDHYEECGYATCPDFAVIARKFIDNLDL